MSNLQGHLCGASPNNMAARYTCRAFVPDMVQANKGHIVSMASLASFVTIATTVDYAVSKAGILAFHEGRYQSGQHCPRTSLIIGISPRAFCLVTEPIRRPSGAYYMIHPGWVRTPMIMNLESASLRKLGSPLEPEQVAHPAVQQILSCRGGPISLPRSQAWRPMLRSFPNWIQEGVRDLAADLEMH